MNVKFLFGIIMASIGTFVVTAADAGDLSKDIFISKAWVQAMPPSQTTTAAYFTVINNSQKEAVLVSASSDIAATAEIHQMSDMKGMMNMAMVSNIHVPAMGKISLQPGGYHIMLINLKKPVKKGDMVALTLHFQDGTSIIVNAEVKMQDADDSSSMPGMVM